MKAEDNVYQFVLIAVPMNSLILCLGHPKSTAWFSEQFCKKKKRYGREVGFVPLFKQK